MFTEIESNAQPCELRIAACGLIMHAQLNSDSEDHLSISPKRFWRGTVTIWEMPPHGSTDSSVARTTGSENGAGAAGIIELTGRIKWFDVSKGYCFIVPD